MAPIGDYERNAFFTGVAFSNGDIVNGDQLTIYYRATDEFLYHAHFSIDEILALLV